jgi:hypothetical protein
MRVKARLHPYLWLVGDGGAVSGSNWSHNVSNKRVHLLRCAADVRGCIQESIKIQPCKERLVAEARQEIVGLSFALHCVSSGLTMNANCFVRVLAIRSARGGSQEDVFACHEWKFSIQAGANGSAVHYQATEDIGKNVERTIKCQERFGE